MRRCLGQQRGRRMVARKRIRHCSGSVPARQCPTRFAVSPGPWRPLRGGPIHAGRPGPLRYRRCLPDSRHPRLGQGPKKRSAPPPRVSPPSARGPSAGIPRATKRVESETVSLRSRIFRLRNVGTHSKRVHLKTQVSTACQATKRRRHQVPWTRRRPRLETGDTAS